MEYALEKILDLTNDHKSLPFWKMAIKKLGQNSVLEEVSETDYLTRKGSVKNPAKYLTSLLNKNLKNYRNKKLRIKLKTQF